MDGVDSWERAGGVYAVDLQTYAGMLGLGTVAMVSKIK